MRKIILATWLLIILGLSYYVLSSNISWSIAELPQILHSEITGFGKWGVVFFIVFTSIRPLVLMPGSVIVLTGGLLFGPIGILYSLLGETIAATVAFCLSRYIGHRFVEEHTGQRFKDFEHKLESHSFRSIFLLRLMILIPNDLISYAAGISDIKLYQFLIASTAGLVPTIILYNYSAVGISDIRYLVLPATIVSLSFIFGRTIRYEYRKHRDKQLQVVAELGEINA